MGFEITNTLLFLASAIFGAILNPVGYFSTKATSDAISYAINKLIDIDIPGQRGRSAGKPLNAGDIEATPLDPIREVFTYKIFPHITPPVSRFVDKRRITDLSADTISSDTEYSKDLRYG